MLNAAEFDSLLARRDGTIALGAFEAAYGQFHGPIYKYLFRMVGNQQAAQDLMHQTFEKAYKYFKSGLTIETGAFTSWLYKIATNTATDELRRRKRIQFTPLSLFNEDRGVGAGVADEQDIGNRLEPRQDQGVFDASWLGYSGNRFEDNVATKELVQRILAKLPPKNSACLLLYEHEGFSCAEISEILHISDSAVKMRLMRARLRFIELYKQEQARSA